MSGDLYALVATLFLAVVQISLQSILTLRQAGLGARHCGFGVASHLWIGCSKQFATIFVKAFGL